MSSFRAFMPSRQTKASSQAWPLVCLDGINPFGSFIPQEQKTIKTIHEKHFSIGWNFGFRKTLFFMFFLCQQLGRQAAGEVKDRASSLLERHGIRLHGIFA